MWNRNESKQESQQREPSKRRPSPRRNLEVLENRIEWLTQRIVQHEAAGRNPSYDKAERAALIWATTTLREFVGIDTESEDEA